jgi:hypothetical protein
MSRCKFYEKVTIDSIPQLDFLDTKINGFIPKNPVGYYQVSQQDISRLDKISHNAYGNTSYWWIICLHNNIKNPFSEISVGDILEIPTLADIHELYRNRKLR